MNGKENTKRSSVEISKAGEIKKTGEIKEADENSRATEKQKPAEKQETSEKNKAREVNRTADAKKSAVYDSCPHCGRELSPWEKVLLSVDRMIMCKNCWYRIILDVLKEDKK